MSALDLGTFRGKRVLVTGHTGFKGSWLAKVLIDSGAIVTGVALEPPTEMSHFEQLSLANSLQHVVCDIRNFELLHKVMDDTQPEYVFHLAAQALVRRSYQNPRETFEINIMGSVNLLEAARLVGSVRSIVFITSDKAYENNEWVWGYRENDRLGGRDPYSASKGSAEIVFSSFLRSYLINEKKIGAASARAGNVIGGGDWAEDRIIPDAVRALKNGEQLILRNPGATRPWQHVLEPISGYLKLALSLRDDPVKFSGSWNFGPESGSVRTVNEVATAFYRHLGSGSVSALTEQSQLHEANLLQLNCDKANQLLNWHAKWSADVAVEKTSEWYRLMLAGENMSAITSRQIVEYFGSQK